MKTCGLLFISGFLMGVTGCELSPDKEGILVFTQSFDFSQTQGDWQGDFTDFPTSATDSSYSLQFSYTDRPENLGSNIKSIRVSGHNYSDDLFMFMKRKITGLSPNTDYTIVFDIELASNAPKGGVGIGGAPGESVFLKAGATSIEPRKVIEGDTYTLNVDKGNQSAAGETTVLLGDIAVGYDTKEYTLITRTNAGLNASSFTAKSSSKGELWLIVGTESGFEGVTTLYYTKVDVVFSTAN